jgi:hypothetical protein
MGCSFGGHTAAKFRGCAGPAEPGYRYRNLHASDYAVSDGNQEFDVVYLFIEIESGSKLCRSRAD